MMMQQDRFYRHYNETARWKSFRVTVDSTDLFIRAKKDMAALARDSVTTVREQIKTHIEQQESFLTSYEPVTAMPGCPAVVRAMYRASEETGTGPMAAVAGAIAEAVGKNLINESDEIIIENGGDLWLKVSDPVTISIYTKSVYYGDIIRIKIDPDDTPCGICTSSGKIGPSFSYGKADAVTVISGDAAFADAAATGTGNIVQDEQTLEKALAYCTGMKKTRGVLIIYRDTMALQGRIELTD